MKVICPGCSAKLKVPEALAGKKVRCVRCRQAVPVPEQDLPWGELDEGDSIHDAIPSSPTPVPARAVPLAKPAVPVAKFVPTRRPPPAAPVAPVAPVAPALPVAPSDDSSDSGNPFDFDAASTVEPPAPRGKKGASFAPVSASPSTTRMRSARDNNKGMVKLAVSVGAFSLLVLGVGVGVFVYKNLRPESAAPKPEKAAESPPTSGPAAAPVASPPANTVADSATAPAPAAARAKPTGRGQSRPAPSRGQPVTTPVRPAPIDPDNPPDPGDGKPIPVPLGGGSMKKDEMKKDEMKKDGKSNAKPEGGKGKDDKPRE